MRNLAFFLSLFLAILHGGRVVASLKRTPSLTHLITSHDITGPEQLGGKSLGISRIGSSSGLILRQLSDPSGSTPKTDEGVLKELQAEGSLKASRPDAKERPA